MNFAQKSSLLKHIYETKNCESFVETGTYEARTTKFMANIAKFVISIELGSELCKIAREAFVSQPHVIIVEGDSNTELEKAMLDERVVRPLIWLDAHWSDGKTAKSLNGKETPVVDELHAIKKSNKNCVVAIDDIRCFDGTRGYPTVSELKELVSSLWGSTTFIHDDDVIWFEV